MLRCRPLDGILLACVIGTALVVRIAWLRAENGSLPRAQWPAEPVIEFAKNLVDSGTFGGPVPLAPPERASPSAAVAPGYPLLLAALCRGVDFATAEAQHEQQREESLRRLAEVVQCLLGGITAGLIFLLARRLFESYTVAVGAGMLAAGHYFWVVATAELADGVLTSFLLSLCLWSGVRLADKADLPTAIATSLALGALALTRAGMLLFVGAAIFWIVTKLRAQRAAWRYVAIIVVIPVLMLLPWTWRNAQRFHRLVPITTDTGLHLWWGNNDEATGGVVPRTIPGTPLVLDTTEGLSELIHPASDRGRRLTDPKLSEAARFASLRREAYGWIRANPRRFLELRFHAAVYFLTGQRMWLEQPPAPLEPAGGAPFDFPGDEVEAPSMDDIGILEPPSIEAPQLPQEPPLEASELQPASQPEEAPAAQLPPPDACAPWALSVLLLGGLAGMRWSWRWRRRVGLLSVALLCGALPTLATYAGLLHGPRLPLDGILLVYAAFALACLIPGISRRLRMRSPEEAAS